LNDVLVSVNGAAVAVPAAVASSSAALIPMMFRMLRSFQGSWFWVLRAQS
jgi:hypothetical protein